MTVYRLTIRIGMTKNHSIIGLAGDFGLTWTKLTD
jgi:hypothetical protein